MSEASEAPQAPAQPDRPAAPSVDFFRWACLVVMTAVLGYLCWAIEDLRQEAKTSSKAVNAHLPQILEKVEGSSATLKEVADDLKKLRDLTGASGPRNKSLAVFADRLLDRLQEAPLQIGVEKLIGKALKEPVEAEAWVRDARKEALWLTFRAKSKAELLERLCKNKFGSDWLVLAAGEGEKPRRLLDWFAEQDAEAKEIAAKLGAKKAE